MTRRFPQPCRSGAGAALIIVLAFIVLLAAVMVIFFSQALSYRIQGNSSFNDFKSSAMAQSGLATVVGDLQQEIVNGSAPVNYGSVAFPTNVYYPKGNTNAVPQRSGNPPLVSGVDPIPNLVRISVRAETFPSGSPGVASRASPDSSTNAAAGGQYVSPSRWNRHYLIPRLNAPTPTIDTAPINNFSAPDWVYVTSAGPKIIQLSDIAGGVKVVGRYAYAIYNEGGLLDANVAGFPSNTTTNATYASSGVSPSAYNTNAYGGSYPVWGSGLKGSEAFADLTATAIGFTQTQIDQLVGWRNNATAQPAGTYNSYSFTKTSAVNFHDAMVNATNGFLTTSGGTWTDPNSGKIDTDQAFSSRQALIAFITDAGMPQDSLQYLATFTRALEQPCYNPPVGRPMVQDAITYAGSQTSPFGSGNDAFGSDRASTTANSAADINPPLLGVRVVNSFVRPDTTTAQAGDALLKTRFPLSRLSLITSSATATQSQSDPIYRNFGLYRSSASSPWMYNHDASNTAGIDRLNAVAALGREPDFFELLKAAINVGSLGKGAGDGYVTGSNHWETAGTQGALVQAHDNLTALQILQIGANIIDQSKSDNFPTRIQFPGDTTVPPNEVRGSEDLPYFYRIRNWITTYSTTQAAVLLQPELWDPYSYNGNASSGLGSSGFVAKTATPTNFRVLLAPDPSYGTGSSPMSVTVTYLAATKAQVAIPLANVSVNSPNYVAATASSPNPPPLTFSAGELNGAWGFREPTLLGVSTMPSSCGMSSTSYTDVNTKMNMTGLFLGSFPVTYVDSNGLSYAANKVTLGPSSAYGCIHFFLQYEDSGGNWPTYDEGSFIYQNGGISLDYHTVANYPFYNSGTSSKAAMFNLDWYGEGRTDPRTGRWGFMCGEYLYTLPVIDASNNEYATYRADGGISFGTHVGSRNDVGFVGGVNGYSTSGVYQYRGFQHAYWAENTVRATYQTDSGDSGYRYNRDPDGVARRAMGGYVTDAASGGTLVSSSQPLPGLPLATGSTTSPNYANRPTILHRPFRSVAELGYAFRDTPWGNINFSFPESGDSALLDVFCVNEISGANGLTAGRIDLNSRQAPALAAMISGSLLDKDDSTSPALAQTMASQIAAVLVARTSNPSSTANYGPLLSRADLVGTWTGAATPAAAKAALTTAVPPDPTKLFTGFSYDIGTIFGVPNLALITRQREAAIRALADASTARTWNLLIDLVAQSGRFPPSSQNFSNFVVEGEKHYWLHVAIDRYTGRVIDSQLEVVRE